MLDSISDMIRSQTFDFGDVPIVGLLVLLEGVLSIDNALVLGLLARRLGPGQRRKALTYGLVGALVFRVIAIFAAVVLLRWMFVKLLGGAYLLYVAVRHLAFPGPGRNPAPAASPEGAARFWPTVLSIELTDIAFAVDSIVAAIALVSGQVAPRAHTAHPKLWVVVVGGMIGVVLMRFAAMVFIRLLDRYPRFETAAYLLVSVIGAKLVAEWVFNRGNTSRLDFHQASSPAFWIFWGLMLASFGVGFLPGKAKPRTNGDGSAP